VGAAGGEADVARTLSILEGLPADDETLAQATVRGVIEGSKLGRRTSRISRLITRSPHAAGVLEGMLIQAREIAADSEAEPAARAEALRTLALDNYETAAPLLASALDPRQPLELQQAAASTLGRFDDDDVSALFLEKWPTLGPLVRSHVIEGLFASEDRLERLVMALEAGTFAPSDLDSTRVQQLLSHPNTAIRERARSTLEDHGLGPRHEVVAAYQNVLTLTSDPARGRAVFDRNCAQCHRLGDLGHAVGPDLTTVAQAGPEKILVNVLDPNREVNPQYINYLIDTEDWGTYSGIIASETATSLTLRRAGGAEDTILRQNIESIRTTKLSIMPEGWEQTLSRENLADLIAFITALSE
jgi:putative heme-binding domain-containing protein